MLSYFWGPFKMAIVVKSVPEKTVNVKAITGAGILMYFGLLCKIQEAT